MLELRFNLRLVAITFTQSAIVVIIQLPIIVNEPFNIQHESLCKCTYDPFVYTFSRGSKCGSDEQTFIAISLYQQAKSDTI